MIMNISLGLFIVSVIANKIILSKITTHIKSKYLSIAQQYNNFDFFKAKPFYPVDILLGKLNKDDYLAKNTLYFRITAITGIVSIFVFLGYFTFRF